MSYTNVTNVTNMDAVLGYISTFLGTIGWTITSNLTAPAVDGSAGPTQALGRIIIARKGDCLATLRSTTQGAGANRLYLLGAYGAYTSGTEGSLPTNDGLNTSGLYTNGVSSTLILSGGAAVRGFQQTVGPFPNLYLFSDAGGNYVHIVLEVSAGVYRHMHFGVLTKFGTWTGGAYFSGTIWSQVNPAISSAGSSSHDVPFDNKLGSSLSPGLCWTVHYENGSDKWIGNANDGLTGGVQRREGRGSVRGGFPTMFKNQQESFFSGLIALGPVIVSAVRESDNPVTTRWIGQVPDFRLINMTNLTPAQEFGIGADTWKVFPMCAKNGLAGQNSSGVSGFAYKKIP